MRICSDTSYVGQLVGRFGNRIAGAAFEIDGKNYNLTANNGGNTLHGGEVGFGKYVWKVLGSGGGKNTYVKLGHRSPAGTNGFPGNLDVTALISVFENTLTLAHEATTDAPTPISLTWHPYFTLSGDPRDSIDEQRLTIAASHYLPVNGSRVPTGEIATVADTPFDFRKSKNLRVPPPSSHPQIALTSGYDHCWVLDQPLRDAGAGRRRAVCAFEWRAHAGENQPARAAGVRRLALPQSSTRNGTASPRTGEFPGRAEPRELPEQHPAAWRDASFVHEFHFPGVTRMKASLLILALVFAAQNASAACAEKRSRDPSFIELSVPDGAIRPAGIADFSFITDETTVDALIAKVGPPDASQGTRNIRLIWCFADTTEVWVDTPDRVVIETVRHDGKAIFKRAKHRL